MCHISCFLSVFQRQLVPKPVGRAELPVVLSSYASCCCSVLPFLPCFDWTLAQRLGWYQLLKTGPFPPDFLYNFFYIPNAFHSIYWYSVYNHGESSIYRAEMLWTFSLLVWIVFYFCISGAYHKIDMDRPWTFVVVVFVVSLFLCACMYRRCTSGGVNTVYFLARKVTATVGDSGLRCVCVTSFEN